MSCEPFDAGVAALHAIAEILGLDEDVAPAGAELQARGLRVNLSGGRRLWEPPLEGHEGRWIKTQNVWAEEAGARWVRKPGSFEVVRALLDRGELCWMNWDVPGNTPAVFLDRPVTAASGIARLALELGTPVLPALVPVDAAGRIEQSEDRHAGDRLPGARFA